MVPAEVVLALGDAASRSSVDDFGLFGVGVLRLVYFGLILRLVVPLRLAALPFLAEACYEFVAGVWEVELLVAGDLVGCIGPVKVMRLMYIVLSTLLTPLLLPWYSFVGVLSLLQMHLRVSGVWVLLSLGGMLFWVIGRLSPWSVWSCLFP